LNIKKSISKELRKKLTEASKKSKFLTVYIYEVVYEKQFFLDFLICGSIIAA